jgi:hypothetical protein
LLLFLRLLLNFSGYSHYWGLLTEIKSDKVFNKMGKLFEILTNHLKEMVKLLNVVNCDKDVSIHFLDFKHVIEIGSVVILACVAFTALYDGFLRILMFFI